MTKQNLYNIFTMTKHIFQYILNITSADLTKQNTTFREAISSLENGEVVASLIVSKVHSRFFQNIRKKKDRGQR